MSGALNLIRVERMSVFVLLHDCLCFCMCVSVVYVLISLFVCVCSVWCCMCVLCMLLYDRVCDCMFL